MTGSSVCLIEADLREPGFARATGLRGLPGLAEVLTGHSALGAAIQPISEPMERPSGVTLRDRRRRYAAQTGRATKSREMEELVKELSARYDLVAVTRRPPPCSPTRFRCSSSRMVCSSSHRWGGAPQIRWPASMRSSKFSMRALSASSPIVPPRDREHRYGSIIGPTARPLARS